MMSNKPIKRHVFEFNPEDNGGESLTLTTEFFDNGDGPPNGIYCTQELTLQSYCNSASFNLCGTRLDPDILRKLADQLENVWQELRQAPKKTSS